MLSRNLILIIPFLCLLSCKNNNVSKINSIPLLNLIEETPLEGHLLPDFLLNIPSEMDIIEDHLIFNGDFGCVLKTFHFSDVVNCYGVKGQGPEDFISAYYAGYDKKDNNIYIWDVSNKSLTELNLTIEEENIAFTQTNRIRKKGDFIFFVYHYLNRNYSLAQRTTGLNTSDFFLLLDSSLNVIQTFGANPLSPNNTNTINQRGVFSSYNSTFTFVSMKYGYITNYEIPGGESVIKKWEYFLTEPLFEENGDKLKFNEENKEGFMDVKMTSKYIFALYSGKVMGIKSGNQEHLPQNLLVFNYDGKLIRNFKLDKKSIRIAVTEDNIVYSLCLDPEARVAKFDLSKNLKE